MCMERNDDELLSEGIGCERLIVIAIGQLGMLSRASIFDHVHIYRAPIWIHRPFSGE